MDTNSQHTPDAAGQITDTNQADSITKQQGYLAPFLPANGLLKPDSIHLASFNGDKIIEKNCIVVKSIWLKLSHDKNTKTTDIVADLNAFAATHNIPQPHIISYLSDDIILTWALWGLSEELVARAVSGMSGKALLTELHTRAKTYGLIGLQVTSVTDSIKGDDYPTIQHGGVCNDTSLFALIKTPITKIPSKKKEPVITKPVAVVPTKPVAAVPDADVEAVEGEPPREYLLEWALYYAKCGFYVFPCRRYMKTPNGSLAPNGYKDATRDEEKIREWWASDAHNIGIATGASGLVVVDFDMVNDEPVGENNYLALPDFEPMLPTLSVLTRSGGKQFYYKANGADISISSNKVAEKVDIRAKGGYVVAPPSYVDRGQVGSGKSKTITHIEAGHYTFLEQTEIADIPAWLEARLLKLESKAKTNTQGVINTSQLNATTQALLAAGSGQKIDTYFPYSERRAEILRECVDLKLPRQKGWVRGQPNTNGVANDTFTSLLFAFRSLVHTEGAMWPDDIARSLFHSIMEQYGSAWASNPNRDGKRFYDPDEIDNAWDNQPLLVEGGSTFSSILYIEDTANAHDRLALTKLKDELKLLKKADIQKVAEVQPDLVKAFTQQQDEYNPYIDSFKPTYRRAEILQEAIKLYMDKAFMGVDNPDALWSIGTFVGKVAHNVLDWHRSLYFIADWPEAKAKKLCVATFQSAYDKAGLVLDLSRLDALWNAETFTFKQTASNGLDSVEGSPSYEDLIEFYVPHRKAELHALLSADRAQFVADSVLNGKSIEERHTGHRFYPALTRQELRNRPKGKALIKGLFPAEGTGCIYGPSMAGKSYMTIALAAAVGRGNTTFGTYKIREPKTVVYLALEGMGDFDNRYSAYEKHYGITDIPNVYTILSPFNIKDVAQLTSSIAHLKPDMVIVDTLAQATTGRDENSAKDMGEITNLLNSMSVDLKCFVLAVHHTGKVVANGMRGSSALLAALDVAVEITRDNDNNRAFCARKVKSGVEGVPIAFKIVSVPLGKDEDGDDLFSGAVDWNAFLAARTPKGANNILAWDTIKNILPLTEVDATALVIKAGVGKDSKRPTTLAKRAINKLIEDSFIARVGDNLQASVAT